VIIKLESFQDLEKLKNNYDAESKREADGDTVLNHLSPTNILFQLCVERTKKLRRVIKESSTSIPTPDKEIKTSKKESDEGDEETVKLDCRICLENEVDSVFKPCGHTLCGECAKNIYNNQKRECSFCRQTIERIDKIYF